MVKLPSLSAKELVKILHKLEYRIVRQTGSHVRMKSLENGRKPLTIPNHKEIGRGLMRKIIRNAGISSEDFKKLI
ncbi:MAG: type II toxin-antitoxin system HicA family toxin [Candidatus Paceibacterota bacterium]